MTPAPNSTADPVAALRARAEGTNVISQTLLATDYLNHFNEIVMLLELIPDMPEMIEEAKAWRPKSYKEHFAASTVADRELAIEACDFVPAQYREPFERTVAQLNDLVALTIGRLEAAIAQGDPEAVRETATTMSRTIQRVLSIADGIIHGSEKTMAQEEIDALIGA